MQVRCCSLSIAAALSFPFFVTAILGVPAAADQCEEIKANIAKIQKDITYEEVHQYLPCCKPGLPDKPVKDPEDQKLLAASQKALLVAEQQLKECNTPPPAPAPKIDGFTASGMGVPDPQIAVGHKYFLAIDTSYLGFYRKDNQHFAPAPFDSAQSVGTLFTTFYKAIDESMNLPTWMCDPDNTALVYKDPPHNKLIKNNFGCIAQNYDARVHLRCAATSLSGLRPPYARSYGSAPPNRVPRGLRPKGPSGLIWDPDPNDHSGKTPQCHTSWKQSWMHRFIVVAISQTDSAGEEDLTKPFHKYAHWRIPWATGRR